MEYIKSYLKVDVPEINSGTKQQQLQPLPLLVRFDSCNRFRPLFDQGSFKDEIQFTDGELIEYLPSEISAQHKNYLRSSQMITYSFWGISIGFAVFCHKIRFLRKLLGQKSWKMFAFKMSALCLPYMYMETLMTTAQEEEMNLLYKKSKESFKKYKLTGDILELNPRIELFGGSLGEIKNADQS